MGNNRIAIRNAVVDLLLGNTSADQSVFSSRDNPLWQSEFPAILIRTSEETAVRESTQSKRYYRNLTLLIDVKVTATEGSDEALDNLVNEIETLIANGPDFGATVLNSLLTKTEISVNSEAEQDVGVATLTYECKYIA